MAKVLGKQTKVEVIQRAIEEIEGRKDMDSRQKKRGIKSLKAAYAKALNKTKS